MATSLLPSFWLTVAGRSVPRDALVSTIKKKKSV
jgi:hypothetical protein